VAADRVKPVVSSGSFANLVTDAKKTGHMKQVFIHDEDKKGE
jgi:hypothetical protein